MQKNKQGFAPILVVVILGMVGVVAYLMLKPRTPSLYPSPAPTTSQAPNGDLANWKTYTAPDSSFSFKHPPEWDNPIVSILSTRTEYTFSDFNFTIMVGVRYNQDLGREMTYKEIVSENEKSATDSKTVTVSGVAGTMFIHKVGGSTEQPEVILQKPGDKNIYWITAYFPATSDPALFDQILSTFKFLDQDRNVSWEEALEFLRSCEVKMAFQTHSLDVSLSLKGGTAVHTKEPKIDLIGEEIDKVREKCGEILYATE